MATVAQIGPRLGIAPTCAALGLPRATYYRRRQPPRDVRPRRPSPRALGDGEQATVLECLHEPRFVDLAPGEVYATLLDEGDVSLLRAHDVPSLGPARRGARAARSAAASRLCAPELLATRPNELWSWDITKLLGPVKWTYFYLYVMLDVFSRYVVGWMVAHREIATLAEQFIDETCARQGIGRDQLTIHADRGVDDLQARRVPAGRPGGHQDPLAPARLQRQPVLGSAVQDAQVPAGVPGPLWLDPGRPGPLPRLLPLVQHPAPPRGSWAADAPRRALRLGRTAHGRPGDRARYGLRHPPGAFSRRLAPSTGTSSGGVDQPTQGPRTLAGIISTQPAHLPARAPSRSLPSIGARS